MTANPVELTRKEIDRKSRKDRMLHDHIIIEVWCRLHQPPDRRTAMGDGWDILHPSYRYGWYTARQELSGRALKVIDDFVERAPYCATILEARKVMLELWNDCQLAALNCLKERYETPRKRATPLFKDIE